MVDVQSRIEVPIEISATDTREINALLEKIERAESKLFKLQAASDDILPEGGGSARDLQNPMSESSHVNKGRKNRRVDTSELTEGRSPIQKTEEEAGGENIGSIGAAGAILLSRKEEAVPKGRETPIDTGGHAPIQRTLEFKKLLERQEKTEHMLDAINEKGAAQGLSILTSFMRSPVGFISGLIAEAAPIIAPILLAKGLMDLVVQELLKDGGVFDRRYKIKVESQVVKTMDRSRLAQIRAGLQEVRLSTSQGIRANRGSTGSNLNLFKPGGSTLYDSNLENYSKGGYQ